MMPCANGAATGIRPRAVSALILVLHAREMARRVTTATGAVIRRTSTAPPVLGILCMLPALYAAAHYPAHAEQVFDWTIGIRFEGFHQAAQSAFIRTTTGMGVS
jgi:hypothetical protein